MGGRNGRATPLPDELPSAAEPEAAELSAHRRDLRGRPGERSRAALSALAADIQADLDTDAADDADVDAGADRTAAPSAEEVLGACVDLVVGARRLASWTLWLELLGVARLLVAWAHRPPVEDLLDGEPVDPDAGPELARRLWAVVSDLGVFVPTGGRLDTADLADAFVSSELAAAAGLSASAADHRVRAAATLFFTDRLPRTRALLRAGMLSETKLKSILTGTAVVSDDDVCRLLEQHLVPDPDLHLALAARSPEHVLDVLDLEANPDGPGGVWPWISRATNPAVRARIVKLVARLDAEAAAERAEKARANRHVRAEALPDGMGAITVEAGREAITAIIGDLDTCVATAKAAGDERSPGQIRADELVHRMSLGAYGAPARPADPDTSAAGVRALRVGLTMPLSTWLRLADEPGTLDGYGAIPAALARQIAHEAVRDHPTTTTWRCIPVDDVHRTVLGVGDTIPTPRHDPTHRQRDLATTADPTCVWPGCSRPSSRCDLDHRVPYEDGGPTCACNLQPTCRRHHVLKGTGLIRPAPAAQPGEASEPSEAGPRTDVPVGSLEWTSWTGRTYRYTPGPAEDAPLTAAERVIIDQARLWRHLDETAKWADADGPTDDDRPGSHDRRARLRDLATGFRLPGPADDDRTQPETSTGMESWKYSVRRQQRRHDREAARAERAEQRADGGRLRNDRPEIIGDLDDVCPF